MHQSSCNAEQCCQNNTIIMLFVSCYLVVIPWYFKGWARIFCVSCRIKSLDFARLYIIALRTSCYKKKADMLKAPYFIFPSKAGKRIMRHCNSDSSLWENPIWLLSLTAKFCFKNWVTKYLLVCLRIKLLLKREQEEFFFRLKWQTGVLNLFIKGNIKLSV